MKWPARLGLAVLGILLVCLFAVVSSRAYAYLTEPRYEGRPVSSWYWELCRERTEARYDSYELYSLKSRAVFGTLGDEAVPFLVKHTLVPQKDSPMARRIGPLLSESEYPDVLRFRFLIPRDVRTEVAQQAIEDARPSWQALAPFLTPILDDPSQRTNAAYGGAIYLMGHIGSGYDEALPYLIHAVTNSVVTYRGLAFQSLKYFGTNAAPALSLVKDLMRSGSHDPNLVALLGIHGSESRDMIPHLVESLKTDVYSGKDIPRENRRKYQVALNILRIDPTQPDALAFFRAHLGDHRLAAAKRFISYNAIYQFPMPESIVQIMEDALNEGYEIRYLMVLSLAILRPEEYRAEVFEPKKPLSSDLMIQSFSELLNIDPNDTEAARHLIHLIPDQVSSERDVQKAGSIIRALGYVSPSQTNVVTWLKAMTKNEIEEVADDARLALERIEWRGRTEDLPDDNWFRY